MSATTIRSIFDDADHRLRTAAYGEETLVIGVEYFESIGAHLAGSIYLRVSSEAWEDWQINALILTTYSGLLAMVSDTFAAFGLEDDPYVQRCVSAAERGFLDRGNDLFSQAIEGGRA